MTELTLDIPQIRIITDALIALKPQAADVESDERLPVEEMDPLINRLLSQAEAQIGAKTFKVTLGPEDTQTVSDALSTFLDLAAEGGDIFLAAEIDSLLGQIERV
jgi:hypothetical protein